ncbi:hypothetical protein A7A08_01728 [Methyloligella halotolerans]|uniref:Lipoprotein n=1 Tax=Methyloligella halotolerans TaxID=1177755 RepID=A0A1E2RZP1_9HYPH|nr:hypothetical protein [Methyloligella halotolerans]ODA67693.1 hypothetical protein A7A08_01728 [Methyloligella halotolerans]
MKAFRFALALAGALALAVSLAGCQKQGAPDVSVQLPKAPDYYAACFEKLTDIPRDRLTRPMAVRLIGQIRQSELRKTRCGKDLLDWYARVRLAYGRS